MDAALVAARKYVAAMQADPTKAWAKHLDAEYIQKAILDRQIPAVVIGDYLVAFTIHPAWFNPEVRVFTDLVTLRITSGASPSIGFRAFIRAVEQLARANGCRGVMLGTDGSGDSRHERVLQRLGYVGRAGTLYKEIQ